ncbi:MAG: DMT family transporter [Paracoccaceae bacterium]
MDLRAIVMGLIFALIWSSAFSSARIIVADAPPLGSLAVRFLLSGLIAIVIARRLGQSWVMTRTQWRATLIFGVCQNALYLGLNFIAMQTIQASLAAIIASTMPLLVALIGWLVFREALRPLAWLGLLTGVAGVVIILGGRIEAGGDVFAVLLAGIGVLALSVATLAVRGAVSGGNLLMVVGLQMLVGAVVLAVASGMLESPQVNWSWRLGLAFSYTTLVPGLVATWVWFSLVRRIGAVQAATFHFLNQFFGVLIAALVLGEAIGARDMLGVAVVMIGILAVQMSRKVRA